MFTCGYILNPLKRLLGTKVRVYPSPFHISTSSRLTLAEAFRDDHVAACSTAFRSATEKNELGGYATVSYPSKMAQRSSTAEWPKF